MTKWNDLHWNECVILLIFIQVAVILMTIILCLQLGCTGFQALPTVKTSFPVDTKNVLMIVLLMNVRLTSVILLLVKWLAFSCDVRFQDCHSVIVILSLSFCHCHSVIVILSLSFWQQTFCIQNQVVLVQVFKNAVKTNKSSKFGKSDYLVLRENNKSSPGIEPRWYVCGSVSSRTERVPILNSWKWFNFVNLLHFLKMPLTTRKKKFKS